MKDYRLTNQPLLPVHPLELNTDGYNLYPAFHLEDGKIYEGLRLMADYIRSCGTVIIDGYVGVFWQQIENNLAALFNASNIHVHICRTVDWFYPEEKINAMVAPYLGEAGSVWGTKCHQDLSNYFDHEKINKCHPDPSADINIVIGVGAALANWDAPIIYVDLPKNELQYRMRAQRITNLGCTQFKSLTEMYKHFYFVDWPVLNRYKKKIFDQIHIIADGQRAEVMTWMYAGDLKGALKAMSENVFRVRPWFEAGVWGGQWIKRNIPFINKDEINYAWSFELISPENGLLFESSQVLLEVSFDFLMFAHAKNVLGEKFAERFGDEFPIRFDFLDTVNGGNLSIQCHPSNAYIKEHFGENFTQDETYYILDAEDHAGVYLGFQQDIDPIQFRKELEKSNHEHIPMEITQYVQLHQAAKHDLFLIPNGTIHSAAEGNLVLEISATPYIFTFKMYDWLRLDLNGQLRPINIEHAFNNLRFDRKGSQVKEELISKPRVLAHGEDWEKIHLPTHPDHFYDIYRYEFKTSVHVITNGSCHVLMLVEGKSISIKTKRGFHQRFRYAETFVVPAAADSYTLSNEDGAVAMVLVALLKQQDN